PRKLQSNCTAVSDFDRAGRKRPPLSLWTLIEIEGVSGAFPILNLIRSGIRIFPLNADRVYRLLSLEIYNHPLGMQRIAFAGEFAGQVWIAFPIGEVRARNGPITAGGEAAVRQSVRQDVFDRFLKFAAAGEVSAPMRGIAPCPILRPVPG